VAREVTAEHETHIWHSAIRRFAMPAIVRSSWRSRMMRHVSVGINLADGQNAAESVSEAVHCAIRIIGWHVRSLRLVGSDSHW